MYGSIYKITDLTDGRVYVGLTKRDPETRKYEHFHSCHNRELKESIAREGLDSFSFEIIDEAEDFDSLAQKEKYWIEKFDSTNPQKGYNKAAGGAGPTEIHWSEEARKISSEVRTNSKWFHHGKDERIYVLPVNVPLYENNPYWEPGYGPGRVRAPDSLETRLKKSLKAKGRPRTAQQVEKHKESLKSRKLHWYTNGVVTKQIPEGEEIPEGFFPGRTFDDEYRKKCGLKNIGRTPWNKGKTKIS